MDPVKWQSIIIEWINCLNLAKPVIKIDDLKNESFLSQFSSILDQNGQISCHSFSGVTDFLKKHYPDYCLDNESSCNEDIQEVIQAFSLLLHYCCMIDGREELLTPLFKNLAITTQLCIKGFLEELQSATSITREILIKAINKIHKFVSTPTKQCASYYVSPKIKHNTPLLEYLSPKKQYGRLDTHQNEIKTLRAQLDLERFEKSDLQEELNQQYDKNKKLDTKIAEKQSQISRLRADLLSIENRTPPRNTKTDESLENKQLRDEIISLEKYVQILHQEQEDLQNDRDKARDKLRKLEENFNESQAEAVQTERKNSKLIEENENYRQELLFLRERCEELTIMIQELNPKKHSDESFESDASIAHSILNKSGSIIDYESLANTVVDVQLIEAHEENKNLRKQLSELEINASELTFQMIQLKNEVTNMMIENQQLHEDNNSLSNKALILIETQKELSETQEKLKKSSNSLLQIIREKEDLNVIVSDINIKLSVSESTINRLTHDCEKLTTEINNNAIQNAQEIEELDMQIKDLICVRDDIQLKLNESINTALQHKSDNNLLKLGMEKFKNDIENCLTKFEDHIPNQLNDEYKNSDTVTKLRSLVDVWEIKNIDDLKNFTTLQTNCNTLSAQIVQLETEIKKLNRNELGMDNEITDLKTSLQNAETKIEHYENEVVVNFNNLVDQYKSVVEEKCRMIADLTKFQNVLQEKESYINNIQDENTNLIHKIQSLAQSLSEENLLKQNLENDCFKLKAIVKERDGFVYALELEKSNLHNKIEVLNEQILTEINNKEELDNMIAKLNAIVSQKDAELIHLKNKESCLLKNIDNLESESKKLKHFHTELEFKCTDANNTVIEKNQYIQDIESRNIIVCRELEKLKNEMKNMQCLKNDLENSCREIKKDVEEKDININQLENEVADLNSKCNCIQAELAASQKCNNKLETLYEEIKMSLHAKECYIKELEDEKMCLTSQAEELNTNLKLLNRDVLNEQKKNMELQQNYTTAEENLKSLNQDVLDEQKKNMELQQNYTTAEENLKSLNQDVLDEQKKNMELQQNYTTAEENLKSLKQNVLDEQKKNMELQQNYTTAEKKYQVETQEYENKMTEYVDQIENLQKQINVFNENIHLINIDLRNISTILNLNGKPPHNNDFIITNISTHLRQLQDQILFIVAEKDEAREEIEASKQKIAYYKTEYESYKHNLETIIDDININLTLQTELKQQKDSDEFTEKFNVEKELEVLEQLKEIHLSEQNKDKEILGDIWIKMCDLKKNIYDLAFEKRRANAEIQSLGQQYNILETLKNDIEQNYNTFSQETNTKITELNSTCQKLKTEKCNYEEAIDLYRQKINTVQISLSESQVSLQELIKEHVAEIENYQGKIKTLEDKNSKLKERIKSAKQEESSTKQELLLMKNDLLEKIKKYENSIDLYENTKHQQELEISKLTKKFNKVTKSFEEFQKVHLETTNKLETDRLEASYQNNDLERTLLELRTHNADIKEKYKTKLDLLISEKDRLNAEFVKLTNEYLKSTDTIKHLEDKMKTEHWKYKDLTGDMKKLESELHNKIQAIKNKSMSKQQEITSLTNKLKDVQKAYEELTETHKEQTRAYEANIEEIKTEHEHKIRLYGNELTNLRETLEKHQLEASHTEAEKDKLYQELNLAVSNKEAFITELRNENLKLKENINSLLEDKEMLSAKLEQITNELVHLKISLMNKDTEYDAKVEEIEETKKKLEQTISLIDNITLTVQNEFQKSTDELHDVERVLDQSKEACSSEINLKDILSAKLNDKITNIKTQIEDIMNTKQKLELELKNISNKHSQIEEEKLLQYHDFEQKLAQLNVECEKRICEINAKNNSVIQSLKSEINEQANDLTDKLDDISNLNLELIEKINKIEVLEIEKQKLILTAENTSIQLDELKQKRDELVADTKHMKQELEENIIRAHQSADDIKDDFAKRFDQIEKERDNEIEFKKQLDIFLQAEKKRVEFLESSISECTIEKDKVKEFSKHICYKIHLIYTKITESNVENPLVQEIEELKQQHLDMEDKMVDLHFEKDLTDKELNVLINEIENLKNLRDEMFNYESMKVDYNSLKDKCDLMSACEEENNALKRNICGLELQLSDLQLENTKYHQFISEKELECESLKNKCDDELSLMKITCANWQKIISDKEIEYNKLLEAQQSLKQKYETENEILKMTNSDLEKLRAELEARIKKNDEHILDSRTDFAILRQKYELLSQKLPTLEMEILNLQQKINQYMKHIADLEEDNLKLSKNYTELSERHAILVEKSGKEHFKTETQLLKLQTVFTATVEENSRIKSECHLLKETAESSKTQLNEVARIKDEYDKLLEDNNKANMELDTLRYKKTRDREEYKRLLDEEKRKHISHSDTQIQEIRNEYEEKLKRMKEKIVKLYREEIEKGKQKIEERKKEHSQAEDVIASMKSQLWVTGTKYMDLKKENELLREKLRLRKEIMADESLVPANFDFHGSQGSISSLKENRLIARVDERRISTLPKNVRLPQGDMIEESVVYSRTRRSITGISSNIEHGLKMEDEEGELFNNTYLSDLKAGRCIEQGRESVSSRFSELQYRNSLCPPHLKSSYPAETQFSSPGQFQEEDIKRGPVEMDDSINSSLLPGEKPRTKKDWGQTLYKKPGPPTPSKNGGRFSLQANEVHAIDVLREHNDNKPRTTSTPNRIKALFTRSGTSHRNDSEVGKKSRCFHYENSLVPFIVHPESSSPNRSSQTFPQSIKVFHIPHTIGQAILYYGNELIVHVVCVMILSAVGTYIAIKYFNL